MPLFLVALVNRARRAHILALVSTAVVIVLLGAGLFAVFEDVGYWTGLYWAITTATTVGYGDVTPHNTAGRILASAVMLTTIPIVGAVFALLAGAAVLSRIRRLFGMETHLPSDAYTVIIGDHPIVPRVCIELDESGDRVVVVAGSRPTGIPDAVVHVPGDPTDDDVIRRSRPDRANRALVALDDDAQALITAIALHAIAPDLEVYAVSESPSVARALRDLGVRHTIASNELLGHTVAKSLETPVAGDLLLTLVDADGYVLRERPVDPSLVSRRLSEARASTEGLVLGMVRGDHLDVGVGSDPELAEGDRLIVLSQRVHAAGG